MIFNKKIKKFILLAVPLVVIMISVLYAITPFSAAVDKLSAEHREALDITAQRRGWVYFEAGGYEGDPNAEMTYQTNNESSIDKDVTCSGYHNLFTKFFYRWKVVPTCTEDGIALIGCGNDGIIGGEGAEVVVDKLNHKVSGDTLNYKYGNGGKGDGYWYSKCDRCDYWEKKGPITYYIDYKSTHSTGTSTAGTMSRSEHTYGTAKTLNKNTFTKTGYKFLGWATSATGGVVYADGQSISNLTVEDSKVITLYAVWEKIPYTITYDANGGTFTGTSNTTYSVTSYYGNNVDLSLTCQKNGLKFVGWATTPKTHVGLQSLKMPTNNITLYALYSIEVSDMKEAILVVWNKNTPSKYSYYNMSLGSIDIRNVYHYTLKNLVASQGLNLTVTDDMKWNIILYDNAGNSSVLKPDEPVPLPKKYLQTVIHYVWSIEKSEYVYHTTTDAFILEGTTYTPQYLATSDSKYPIGYTGAGIDPPYVVTGDATKAAYYNPIEYKLYFNPNKGVCDIPYKTVYMNYYYGDLPVATRVGHDFTGWYTHPTDGAQVRSTDIYTTPGDSTVYAHWKVHSHKVVYDFWTNGGTSATKYNALVNYGSSVDLSVKATKSGWTFVGWNTDPDATTGLSGYTMPDDDVVLYAIYKKDIVAGFVDKTDTDYVTRYVVSTIYGNNTSGDILVPVQNTMSNWNCLGWSMSQSANARVEVLSGSTISLDKNTIFYGCYSRNITLSYDTNGSAWDIPPVTQEGFFNASGNVLYPTFDISSAPVLDNHSFVAWVELDGNNTVVASHEAGTEVVFEKDTLLTAKWDKIPEIEAYDRYFTLEEAKNGSITSERLFEKVTATDKEDGILVNGTSVTIIDFDSLDFLSKEELEVTYQAIDSFGNTVTKTVTVHVVDTTVNLSPIIYYTRFISKDFYTDGENLVDATQGGLEATSIWRTDESYKRIIERSLFNTKSNEEYKIIDTFGLNTEVKVAGSGKWEHLEETWVFTREDIEAVKEFVNEHGYGNIKEDGAIDKFLELFHRCKK